MTDFEKCRRAYDISKDKEKTKKDIRVWVAAGKITPEDYETITGEPYEVVPEV